MLIFGSFKLKILDIYIFFLWAIRSVVIRTRGSNEYPLMWISNLFCFFRLDQLHCIIEFWLSIYIFFFFFNLFKVVFAIWKVGRNSRNIHRVSWCLNWSELWYITDWLTRYFFLWIIILILDCIFMTLASISFVCPWFNLFISSLQITLFSKHKIICFNEVFSNDVNLL